MEFEFIDAKTRGKNLKIDNFLLKKNKSRENFIDFKCCNKDCKSTLSMNGTETQILNNPTPHNHPPPTEQIESENFRKRVLNSIENNPTRPLKQTYDNQVQISNTEEFIPPRYDQIRRSMGVTRKNSTINSKKF